MLGDSQIGKTSLMVKYVEGHFDEDYIQTLGTCPTRNLIHRYASSPVLTHTPSHLGVNFMEKTITVRRTSITFSLWDLGGQREFVNMLPLVCNDAVAILFMFDLSRKSTLNSVKEWYRQARGFNKVCVLFGLSVMHTLLQFGVIAAMCARHLHLIDWLWANGHNALAMATTCTHLDTLVIVYATGDTPMGTSG